MTSATCLLHRINDSSGIMQVKSLLKFPSKIPLSGLTDDTPWFCKSPHFLIHGPKMLIPAQSRISSVTIEYSPSFAEINQELASDASPPQIKLNSCKNKKSLRQIYFN
jgi:hypothetical protein